MQNDIKDIKDEKNDATYKLINAHFSQIIKHIIEYERIIMKKYVYDKTLDFDILKHINLKELLKLYDELLLCYGTKKYKEYSKHLKIFALIQYIFNSVLNKTHHGMLYEWGKILNIVESDESDESDNIVFSIRNDDFIKYIIDTFDIANIANHDVFSTYKKLSNKMYGENKDEIDKKQDMISLTEIKYATDGIIFVPIDEFYPSDSGNLIWDTQYKWKPSSKLTIDFMLMKSQSNSKNDVYKLYVTSRGRLIPFVPSITYGKKYDELIESKGFNIPNIVHECIFENGEWKIFRQRFDKSAPNGADVADDVWNLININIKPEDITYDNAIILKNKQEETEYFVAKDGTTRTAMHIYHYKQKTRLYKFTQTHILKKENMSSVKLFEIAGGRFGDMHNWEKCGFRNICVSDLNLVALQEGHKRKTKKQLNISIVPIDFSKSLLTNDCIVGDNKQSFYDDNINDKKYDVVSCQFALHYFCKSEDTIRQFIDNVTQIINEDGLLIFSIIDGHRIIEKMKEEKNTKISGSYEGNVIWRIEAEFDYNTDMPITGKQIKVYISTIGETYAEYLIDVALIHNLLIENNFVNEGYFDFGKKIAQDEEYSKDEYNELKVYTTFHRGLIYRKLKSGEVVTKNSKISDDKKTD